DPLGAACPPQGMSLVGAGSDAPVESGHGLDIVVEHVGLGLDHKLDRALLAQKVRRQHLDCRLLRCRSDCPDSRRKMRGTSVREIVSVDTSLYAMGEAELGDRRPSAFRS